MALYKIPPSPITSDRLSPANITQREVEILMLLYTGHTQNGIAERLHLSRHTIKNHIAHMCDKVGATSTIGLLQWYVDSILMDYCSQDFISLASLE